ncbi:hypothetical protein PUNSTDRAFT_137832 [Punctularia strigosozonata HHB-11173 SS5]|uniref:F-box domain-containing protein n=1 Tax=Punctularia strigosozonata (strain HHB-11173) TaxID=741275 RepID=R7S5W0_PUNST|nr:uncharacterized protein PUNSTDRAFT_137832 [Punctularia strigosozonata HHB-11173 SS5]EIN05151.1 hypothetical protein PUNSTDRAFT_137832 [Punctularia strigosozonata HHB-11173 SS5]
MFCVICGGPCSEVFLNPSKTHYIQFNELPGLSHDDGIWLGRSLVAVYADCISPPGRFEGGGSGAVVAPRRDDDPAAVADQETLERDDPVNRPPNTRSCLRSGRFEVHLTTGLLAHELCLRLAVCWARASHPRSFPSEGPALPAWYLWTNSGPVCAWAFQVHIDDPDLVTMSHLVVSSPWTYQAAGKPPQRNYIRIMENFRFGYGDEDDPAGAWMDGFDERMEYVHEADFGIVHLKRPDHFPAVHDLPAGTPAAPPESVFPYACPADVVLQILARLDGASLRALECTSRAWRDFLCCQLAQHHVWLPLIRSSRLVPTDADWTRSADGVRQALASAERVSDWRRHYRDCLKSPNMRNRARIARAVWALSHLLGHCGCLPGSPSCC